MLFLSRCHSPTSACSGGITPWRRMTSRLVRFAFVMAPRARDSGRQDDAETRLCQCLQHAALRCAHRARHLGAGYSVVDFLVSGNVVGFVDLPYALWQGRFISQVDPASLGATYFIPTLVVPALLITHVVAFWLLLSKRALAGGSTVASTHYVASPHACGERCTGA